MDTQVWYAQLNKPFFAPPPSIFGPVWSVLYTIILISFGYVFFKFIKKELNFKQVAPFILNLIFNVLFIPLQTGLKNNFLASVDVTLVLITLIWLMRIVKNKYKWVFYAQIPYFLWVSFATILQITIFLLNV